MTINRLAGVKITSPKSWLKPPPRLVQPTPFKPPIRADQPEAIAEARNEKRRKRYDTDEQYRLTLAERSRTRYRQMNQLELANCLRSLGFYTTLSVSIRVHLPNGTVRTFPVISLPDTARCLQKTYQTLWRWKERGMIPTPVLVSEGRNTVMFHTEEVRVLIEEIGAHEQAMKYYRESHGQVREKIFNRINAIRSTWEKK